jgi:hypothetical protein
VDDLEAPESRPRHDHLDAAEIDGQLRAALAARAEMLDLDPATIRSPSPGALIARSHNGTLLRIDYYAYPAHELER